MTTLNDGPSTVATGAALRTARRCASARITTRIVLSTIRIVATIMNAQRKPNATWTSRKPMLLAIRASE